MKRRSVWALILLVAVCAAIFAAYLYKTSLTRDVAAPAIHLSSDTLMLSVFDGQEKLLDGVTAKDERDGDVTELLVVEGISALRGDHSATVTYAAFDKSGNVSKATRTVIYTDYISPRFSLTQALMYPGNVAANVLQRVTAVDMLEGDLSQRVKAGLVGESTSIDSVGTHQVQLRVTNSMGDTAYLTVPVEVYAAGTYNATVELTEYLIYVEKGTDIFPEDYLSKLTYSNQVYSGEDLWKNGAVEVHSDVNTEQAGVYMVDYTVTMEGRTGFSRLIVVVEE